MLAEGDRYGLCASMPHGVEDELAYDSQNVVQGGVRYFRAWYVEANGYVGIAMARGECCANGLIESIVKTAADVGTMAAMDAARESLLSLAAEINKARP